MLETLQKAEAAHTEQVAAWRGVLATAVKGSAEASAAVDAILHHLRVLVDIRRDIAKEMM